MSWVSDFFGGGSAPDASTDGEERDFTSGWFDGVPGNEGNEANEGNEGNEGGTTSDNPTSDSQDQTTGET